MQKVGKILKKGTRMMTCKPLKRKVKMETVTRLRMENISRTKKLIKELCLPKNTT